MGEIRSDVTPVLLFCGALYNDSDAYEEAKRRMSFEWGPVLLASESFNFDHTDYYQGEMGNEIKRVFLAFRNLITPSELALSKVVSSQIEQDLSRAGKRRVNLDPGYLHQAKVVLASSKDYSHRIYLDRGIYGEVTLAFSGGTYRVFEWTYPDYREERVLSFFNHARRLYVEQLKLGVSGT